MRLTDEELDAMHLSFFESAKENLLTHGWVRPVVMFAFDSEDPEAALKRCGLGMYKVHGEAPPYVAIVPMDYSDSSILDYLERQTEDAQAKQALQLLRQLGRVHFPPDGKDSTVLKVYCEANRLTPPDIIAGLLRWVGRTLPAYALFKVDETYVATLDEKEAERRMREGGPQPRDIPGRKEAVLVTLETRTRSALHMATFERQVPGDESTPPVRFNPQAVPEFDSMSGRYFGLLSDPPAEAVR